jgi:ribose/xylose/arabinose/galactoside ABC-type transport system permease subunit
MKKYIKGINWRELGILYALILLWIILIATNENFRRFDFFNTIFRESSFIGICGIGMTFCIASRHFDQSVAGMMAFMSCTLTLLITKFSPLMGTAGIVLSVVLVICLGVLLGAFNGILVAKVRIPAFIATLGTMFSFRAFAFIVSSGKPTIIKDTGFTGLGNGDFLGLPIPFLVMIVCGVVGTVILKKTKLGRDTLAIGNSEHASKISGIRIDRVKILIFMMVGLFTSISTVLITSYLWSSNPGMKEGFEFTVISAVVLGGTALSGGKGSMFNTIVAAIFLYSVKSGMDAYNFDTFAQRVVEGAILLFGFSINGIRALIANYRVKRNARKQSLLKQGMTS